MKTGLTLIHEVDGITFYGELRFADLAFLKLSKGDLAMIADLGGQAPAHATLLVLEMLFRRLNAASTKAKSD